MRENGDRVGPSIESNNFDAIRLIAALCVLISHAFPLTYGSDEFEPVYRWSHGQTTIGTIAVGVFFAISGFLITRSFVHAGRSWGGVSRFVRARVLRLVPALLVALLLLAFLFGPLVSSQPIADYFQFPQMVRFILINCSFVSFHDTLPGVFIHNPFPNSVDGSLWTLRHEVRCYLMIFLLGVAGLLRAFSNSNYPYPAWVK